MDDAVRTLRAETRVEFTTTKGRVHATVMLIAAQERLRLDILSPIGTTLQTMVVDGDSYALLDVEHGRFERGDARSCGIRILPIALSPGDASRALRGGTPLLDGPSEVSWDARAGAEVLRVHADDGRTQEIRLVGDRGRWRLLRNEVHDARGQSELLLEPLDGAIRIRSQTRAESIEIRFRRAESNVDLADAVFHLTPPPGVEIRENVVCDRR